MGQRSTIRGFLFPCNPPARPRKHIEILAERARAFFEWYRIEENRQIFDQGIHFANSARMRRREDFAGKEKDMTTFDRKLTTLIPLPDEEDLKNFEMYAEYCAALDHCADSQEHQNARVMASMWYCLKLSPPSLAMSWIEQWFHRS